MKTRKLLLVVLSILFVILFSGCGTHQKHKAAAVERWQKATAEAKIPIAAELFSNGRIDDARKTLEEIIQSDPELSEAHILMGRVHYSQLRYDLANQSFERAIQTDGRCHQGWYWLGRTAQRVGKNIQSCEFFEKALSYEPANTEYIIAAAQGYVSLDEHQKAVDILLKKAKSLQNSSLLKTVAADILSRKGQVQQAIVLYKQVLLRDSENYDVVESLGYCYVLENDWANAAEMFERLISVSHGEEKATYLELVGICSMNDNEYGKAVSYYDQLTVSQRQDADLWLKLGQAALGAKSPARALACAKRALAIRPGWADAIALKGCADYVNGDYTTAINTFKALTSNKKVGHLAWVMTGRSYQQLGQTEKAEKAFENADKLEPDSKLAAVINSEKQ